MALTGKQERRLWRCLDRMKYQPFNPADIKGKMIEFTAKVEAAEKLAGAVYAATENEGAEWVNEELCKAEEILDLEVME